MRSGKYNENHLFKTETENVLARETVYHLSKLDIIKDLFFNYLAEFLFIKN